MTCYRTLHNLIDTLAKELNDLEGNDLARLATKARSVTGAIDPDNNSALDSITVGEYQPEIGDEEYLNHVRYSEWWLTEVINDGFDFLSIHRPDLFTTTEKHLLTPGCVQQSLPDSCIRFNQITLAGDACGNHVTMPTRIKMSQMKSAMALGNAGKGCAVALGSESGGYSPDYAYDPENPRVFFVHPAPPEGENSYIMMACSRKPPCFEWDADKDTLIYDNTTAPVQEIYELFIVEYTKYRAYSTHTESERTILLAQQHFGRAMTIVNTGRLADYAYDHPDLHLVGTIDKKVGNPNVVLRHTNDS